MSVTLRILVPPERDRAATVALSAGGGSIATGYAVASASPEIAAAHGNPECDPLRLWGHPATGEYHSVYRQRLRYGQAQEYGWHAVMCEPVAGQALEAQATGRGGLLVFAGPPGEDGLLRRTQGGLRLESKLMDLINDRFKHEWFIRVFIDLMKRPAVWQFWKRLPVTPALSLSPVVASDPPTDELITAEVLQAEIKRLRSYTGPGTGPSDNSSSSASDKRSDASRDRERETTSDFSQDYSHSSSSSDDDSSSHAGGGASGGWDSGSSSSDSSSSTDSRD